jgi:hypothetical protein
LAQLPVPPLHARAHRIWTGAARVCCGPLLLRVPVLSLSFATRISGAHAAVACCPYYNCPSAQLERLQSLADARIRWTGIKKVRDSQVICWPRIIHLPAAPRWEQARPARARQIARTKGCCGPSSRHAILAGAHFIYSLVFDS